MPRIKECRDLLWNNGGKILAAALIACIASNALGSLSVHRNPPIVSQEARAQAQTYREDAKMYRFFQTIPQAVPYHQRAAAREEYCTERARQLSGLRPR